MERAFFYRKILNGNNGDELRKMILNYKIRRLQNTNFFIRKILFQMATTSYPKGAIIDKRLSHYEFRVLVYVCEKIGKKTMVFINEDLWKGFGAKKTQFMRCLNRLEVKKYLKWYNGTMEAIMRMK